MVLEKEFITNTFEHTIINFNGEFTSAIDAKISIFDRGFLYGDSVYEVTRSYDGKILYLDEHLDRLFNSAEIISLKLTYSRDEIKKHILETFKKINLPNVYLRFMLTRGVSDIGMDITNTGPNNLIIIARAQKENPSWWYEKGVHFIISSVERNSKLALDPNAKSGNYLNSILAYIEAKNKKAFDAIMLNKDGLVTEGTTNNVWIIKNNTVYTPPLSVGILKGITRDAVIEVCKLHHIPLEQKNFTKEELLSADECFVTSSTKELVPVVQIDEKTIGHGKPGSITLKLLEFYRSYIKDLIKKSVDK